jgi:hypothetical protein
MGNGNGNGRSQTPIHITDDAVRGLRDLTTDQLAALAKAALREYAGRFPNARNVPLPNGVTLVTTTDLALATYWDMRGCPVVAVRPSTAPRAGRHQAAEFVHADYDGSSKRLALAFISSESADYNARMGTLKKEAIRVRDMRKS